MQKHLIIFLLLAPLLVAAPPQVDSITLNSSLGKNTTYENLTLNFSVSDPDGDAVKNITDWQYWFPAISAFRSIASQLMPFENHSDASTKAVDYSSFSNNGSVVGATFLPTGGHDGFGAYEFANTGYISIPDTPLNRMGPQLTAISFWIKTTDSAATLVEKKGFDDVYKVYIFSGKVSFYIAPGGGSLTVTSTTPINDGNWHHIVAWRNETYGIGIWVDGVLEDYKRNTAMLNSVDTSNPLYIGNVDFSGIIDDFYFFSITKGATVLPFTENMVLSLYNDNYLSIYDSLITSPGETYRVRLTPHDGITNATTTTSNTLTIVPDLISPSNNSYVGEPILLNWTFNDQVEFHLLVDNDSDFSSPEVDVTLTTADTNYTISPGTLTSGLKYYWKVQANNSYERSGFSEVWQFTVNNPPTISSLNLNSTFGNNRTTENLSISFTASDSDGVPVKNITDWQVWHQASSSFRSIAPLMLLFENHPEASTKVVDYSSFGNNGSVVGATFLPTGGHDGFGAYSFSGSDYIEVPHSDSIEMGPQLTTISFWIKTTDDNANLVYKGSGVIDYYRVDIVNGKAKFEIWPGLGGISVTSTTSINDGNWHHIVAWRNETYGIGIWVDGVLEDYKRGSGLLNSVDTSAPLYLGRNFDGVLDDFYFFSFASASWGKQGEALTEKEILNLYQNNSLYSIDSIHTDPSQTWRVLVTPHDGVTNGTTTTSNTLTIVPELSSPLNNSITSLPLTLEWIFRDQVEYHVQVDNNPDFSSPEVDVTLTSTIPSHTINSLTSGTYYWRVQANNSYERSGFSEAWQFQLLGSPLNCFEANTPAGIYEISQNQVGVIPGQKACINVTANDVVIDCNGYNVSNDGTANAFGIYAVGVTNTTILNCNVDSYEVGAYFSSSDINLSNLKLRNSTSELSFSSATNFVATNITIDSPSILLSNYTNFDLKITNSGNLNISWILPPTPPAGYAIFENKSINISSDGGIIDSVVLHWTDDEAAQYYESSLTLQLLNNTWNILNSSPSQDANTLSYNNLYANGTLAIFENQNFQITNCFIVKKPGYHILKNNLTGRIVIVNSSGEFFQDMCINVTVDDVIIDCNSNSIRNDGTGKFGIYSNGRNNLTVKGCSISNYSYGINLTASSNVELNNLHLYDHLKDVVVGAIGNPSENITIKGVKLDNPAGDNINSSIISMFIPSTQSTNISWASTPTPLPPGVNYPTGKSFLLESLSYIINLTLNYTIEEIRNLGIDENSLEMWKFSSGSWSNITSYFNVSGTSTSSANFSNFSIFSLMGTAPYTPPPSGEPDKPLKISTDFICPDNTLEVTVTSDGREVRDARVVVKENSIPYIKAEYTDRDGIATFQLPDNGTYKITARKSGYQTAQKTQTIELCQEPQQPQNQTQEEQNIIISTQPVSLIIRAPPEVNQSEQFRVEAYYSNGSIASGIKILAVSDNSTYSIVIGEDGGAMLSIDVPGLYTYSSTLPIQSTTTTLVKEIKVFQTEVPLQIDETLPVLIDPDVAGNYVAEVYTGDTLITSVEAQQDQSVRLTLPRGKYRVIIKSQQEIKGINLEVERKQLTFALSDTMAILGVVLILLAVFIFILLFLRRRRRQPQPFESKNG